VPAHNLPTTVVGCAAIIIGLCVLYQWWRYDEEYRLEWYPLAKRLGIAGLIATAALFFATNGNGGRSPAKTTTITLRPVTHPTNDPHTVFPPAVKLPAVPLIHVVDLPAPKAQRKLVAVKRRAPVRAHASHPRSKPPLQHRARPARPVAVASVVRSSVPVHHAAVHSALAVTHTATVVASPAPRSAPVYRTTTVYRAAPAQYSAPRRVTPSGGTSVATRSSSSPSGGVSISVTPGRSGAPQGSTSHATHTAAGPTGSTSTR
jgi:hypothetical protein